MTKKLFLKELRRELSMLPFDEQEEAVSYYEEYLDEAEDEAVAIAGLGSPKALAKTIKLEAATAPTAKAPQTAREGVSKIWIVVAAIFSAPIALPLAISMFAVVFSLLVAVASVLFALMVASVAMTGAGIFVIGAGVVMLPLGVSTSLFFAGQGLFLLGLGLLWGKGMWLVSKATAVVLLRMLSKLFRRLSGKQSREVA